jgi:glycerol-3-phosphate acyltransferase PlsY
MDGWSYVGVGIVSYLLGSIPSGVIAARAFRQADVRTMGSGHTGAINTYRAAGFAPAALTFLADGAKGVLAISAARQWLGEGWAIPLAATLAVIGHCYPVFARLRGGMGLTTAGGVFLVLQPLVLVTLIIGWFPIRWLLRESLRHHTGAQAPQGQGDESSYASLGVALLLPVLLLFVRVEPFIQTAGVGVGAVLFWRHLQVLVWRRRAIGSPG